MSSISRGSEADSFPEFVLRCRLSTALTVMTNYSGFSAAQLLGALPRVVHGFQQTLAVAVIIAAQFPHKHSAEAAFLHDVASLSRGGRLIIVGDEAGEV